MLCRNGEALTSTEEPLTWWQCLCEANERGLVQRASSYNFILAPFVGIYEWEHPKIIDTVRAYRSSHPTGEGAARERYDHADDALSLIAASSNPTGEKSDG